jgi:hypothetical protein
MVSICMDTEKKWKVSDDWSFSDALLLACFELWVTYTPPDDSEILNDCETSLDTSHNNFHVLQQM